LSEAIVLVKYILIVLLVFISGCTTPTIQSKEKSNVSIKEGAYERKNLPLPMANTSILDQKTGSTKVRHDSETTVKSNDFKGLSQNGSLYPRLRTVFYPKVVITPLPTPPTGDSSTTTGVVFGIHMPGATK
jgi:hypothetical protein